MKSSEIVNKDRNNGTMSERHIGKSMFLYTLLRTLFNFCRKLSFTKVTLTNTTKRKSTKAISKRKREIPAKVSSVLIYEKPTF